MKKEIREKISKLPSFVRDSICEDYTTKAIVGINEDYFKNDEEKLEVLKNIIGLTILKDIKIEQLDEVIREGLELDDKKSIEISLIVLCEILYPINSYFPGIEDEILKLGGKIPKEKPKQLTEQLLKREE
ncbi:hypothetical protein KAK05_00065, partial [Candidatus Parcubacteria bacterium]|nr:hypothetical protein [Candidatus Parcubacteria bacterium]